MCSRESQRLPSAAIVAKLGCSAPLPIECRESIRYLEPSIWFFVRFIPEGQVSSSKTNRFQLVEVSGYHEQIIDEGSSSGCTIHLGHKYVSMRVVGDKIGNFEFYCHCDEKTSQLLMLGRV